MTGLYIETNQLNTTSRTPEYNVRDANTHNIIGTV
jgi:hypothetical protein